MKKLSLCCISLRLKGTQLPSGQDFVPAVYMYMYSFMVSSIKNPNQPNIYMYIQINQICTNIYIYNWFPLVHHTDFLITQTPPKPKTKNTSQPGFSKTCWLTFPSASRNQHEEKSSFTVPHFPRHSGPK